MMLPRTIISAVVVIAHQNVAFAIDEPSDVNEECGLYLAESGKRDSGWGVFAGKQYVKGQIVGASLGIPVTDPERIINDEGALSEFLSDSRVVGGLYEAENVLTALPGLGMLVNYHPLFPNVDLGGLTEDILLDRKNHPGAGSISNYNDFGYVTNQEISPGMELFSVPPSDSWYRDANMPERADYDRAQKITMELAHFQDEHPELTEAQLVDILYRMKNDMIAKDDKSSALLPSTRDELRRAAALGVGALEIELGDFSWVQNNGKCLDNIKQGKSTIPGAGRGAFANRFMPKGSVISPAPLVQVMDREAFRIDASNNATEQLMMNYCFGHRKSPLLLCPTTYVSLINHKSADEVNSKMRWASSSKSPSKTTAEQNYLLGSLEDLKTESGKASFNSRLMLEFTATKDIHPGDEIFFDYGDEWETAWRNHVENWQKSSDIDDDYIPAKMMNEELRPIILSSDPMMSKYSYKCRIEPIAFEKENREGHEQDYRDLVDIDDEWSDDYLNLLNHTNEQINWWPCEVVDLETESSTFKIAVFTKNLKERVILRRLKNVPEYAIRFADKPYHSDQHLKTAFRHYIPIPDSIFPLRWRQDYVTTDSIALGKKDDGGDVRFGDSNHQSEAYEETLRGMKCGIYFAPSNIPNAGFGTYTAVSLQGAGIKTGTSLPAIPFIHFDKHEGEKWDALDYVWDGESLGISYEACRNVKASSVSVLQVNDGALANSHPGLVNLKLVNTVYTPVLDRRTDPGAGAFSDYIEYSFESNQEISAGEELFVSYGESWFSDRQSFNDVPLSANYNEANLILASLLGLVSLDKDGLLISIIEDLLANVIKPFVVKEQRTLVALADINSWSSILGVFERNGTAQSGTELRSPGWFEKNGQCLDHIYVKRSTLEQAGQGAFSRRHLIKGDTVISAPLIATWGRDMFEMNATYLPEDIQRTQLLLNYQFGHPDSSVYFFPITTVIAINHRSDRSRLGKSPNAELRWSTWNKRSAYFLLRPLEDLKKERYSTMVLEVVATREIHPDEEVFIDYGEEWEIAWDKHVRDFSSEVPCRKANKLCFNSSRVVAHMNDDAFNVLYHEWSDEHFTICTYDQSLDNSEHDIILRKEKDSQSDTSFTFEYTNTTVRIEWDNIGFNLTDRSSYSSPCQITWASEEERVFNVVYFTDIVPEGTDHRVLRPHYNLPATSLKFLNLPYKSDMFWAGAFRKEIKIPDEIFPLYWKDLLAK